MNKLRVALAALLLFCASQALAQNYSGPGALGLGATVIYGGTNNAIEYNNAGALGEVATINNAVMVTNSSGVPSFSTSLPAGFSLPSQATNTVLGNATSGSAAPTALPVGSCSAAADALIWTTNTGFGCNTAITAAAVPASGLTGATLASGVTGSSLTSVGTLTGGGTGTGFTLALGSSTITGLLGGTNGGTGVNNGAKTLTLGANLATTGAGAATFALGASTQTYTFPTVTDTLPGLGQANAFTGNETHSGTEGFSNTVTFSAGFVDASYAYHTETTGFTLTLACANQHTLLDPAATLASGTITMCPAPVDGQIAKVVTSHQITALTVAANAGQSILGAPTVVPLGGVIECVYKNSNTTWYC